MKVKDTQQQRLMSILATTSFPGISRTRSSERESGRRDPWEPDCTDTSNVCLDLATERDRQLKTARAN